MLLSLYNRRKKYARITISMNYLPENKLYFWKKLLRSDDLLNRDTLTLQALVFYKDRFIFPDISFSHKRNQEFYNNATPLHFDKQIVAQYLFELADFEPYCLNLKNIKINKNYIDRYKSKRREHLAHRHKLRVASMTGDERVGSIEDINKDPYLADVHCGLGEQIFAKAEKESPLTLDEFKAISGFDMVSDYITFQIALNKTNLKKRINSYLGKFIDGELSPEGKHYYSFEKQKALFYQAVETQEADYGHKNLVLTKSDACPQRETSAQVRFWELIFALEKLGEIKINEFGVKTNPKIDIYVAVNILKREKQKKTQGEHLEVPTTPRVLGEYLWILNQINEERERTPANEAISYPVSEPFIAKGIPMPEQETLILRKLEGEYNIIKITEKWITDNIYRVKIRAVIITDLQKFKNFYQKIKNTLGKIPKPTTLNKNTKQNALKETIQREPIPIKIVGQPTIKVEKEFNDTQKRHNKFPYKIPAGTTWEQFVFTFLDKENIKIDVKGKTYEADYKEIGFEDKRTQKPNKQWILLEILAREELGGELTLKDPEAKVTFKKTKELLARTLQNYFSIDYDPFYPYRLGLPDKGKKANSYKIKIVLIPASQGESDKEHEHKKMTLDEQIEDLYKEKATQVYVENE